MMAPSEMMERKKNNPHRKLAEKIARSLFTDGQGERADRLQMMHKTHPSPSERAGAGWCEAAVADRIAEILLSNAVVTHAETGSRAHGESRPR